MIKPLIVQSSNRGQLYFWTPSIVGASNVDVSDFVRLYLRTLPIVDVFEQQETIQWDNLCEQDNIGLINVSDMRMKQLLQVQRQWSSYCIQNIYSDY